MSSLVNVRAALGQLIGHEAPAGGACVPCARGNGTSGDASDPPRWLYDVVRQFQPNRVLLKDPGLARYEAASKVIKKAKTGAVVPAPAADKGKGKDQTAAGPSTPGKSPKKRAAEDSPGEKDKTGKKKKKTKKAPEPPARVDATPHSGPTFDSVLYQTPLDWPMIYRAENELWFMDAFEQRPSNGITRTNGYHPQLG
ncbi:hypothetical protein PENPOL_c007G09856 [Penicillium polonicum]|uniref:Uncharacterized protein n=1 Tax=Penicillium polonicum TaxID=60169 RepID=A0A1V6NIN8_PENPO|nr:hypothetical protein PENPOL_c007G09856 [Penicillium polonicum]